MKQSYNPFKMWGAWAGLVILPLFMYGSLALDEFARNDLMEVIAKPGMGLYTVIDYNIICRVFVGLGQAEMPSDCNMCCDYNRLIHNGLWFTQKIVFIAFLLIPGFLIGWGIHSFVRRLSK